MDFLEFHQIKDAFARRTITLAAGSSGAGGRRRGRHCARKGHLSRGRPPCGPHSGAVPRPAGPHRRGVRRLWRGGRRARPLVGLLLLFLQIDARDASIILLISPSFKSKLTISLNIFLSSIYIMYMYIIYIFFLIVKRNHIFF